MPTTSPAILNNGRRCCRGYRRGDLHKLAPSFSSVRNALTMPFDTVDSSDRGSYSNDFLSTWSRSESRELMCEIGPVRLDDSHVAILVGCKHTIDRKESTVRQFDDSRAAVLDDMVVGNDAAIFAYEETAAWVIGWPSLSDMTMETIDPFASRISLGYLDGGPCWSLARSVPTSPPPATERLPCTS